MKRLLAAVLAALSLFSLTACGAPSGDAPPPEPPAKETPAFEPEAMPSTEPETPIEPEAPEDPIDSLLASMTLEEKVGQLFFVRCPTDSAVEDVSTYHLSGYILFGRDLQDANGGWLTEEAFTAALHAYQAAASIPLLIGVDEEGGTVVRVSRNPNLFQKKFRSPQQIQREASGHGDAFAEDAWEKSNALLRLGINVNLAPVCDVSTNPGDFIYDRALGQDAQATAEYAASVAGAMKEAGIGCVLKHFPGYGNNADTHTGIAVDQRPMETFETSDFLPFRAGIQAGGGTAAVLVSHNIVQCMDPDLPASLSPAVHEILRDKLGFDGVVMTDDLAMKAVSAYAGDGAVAVMALEAGNDLIITTDYRAQVPKVIEAVERGALAEDVIDDACRRVLTWKQNLGLLEELP